MKWIEKKFKRAVRRGQIRKALMYKHLTAIVISSISLILFAIFGFDYVAHNSGTRLAWLKAVAVGMPLLLVILTVTVSDVVLFKMELSIRASKRDLRRKMLDLEKLKRSARSSDD